MWCSRRRRWLRSRTGTGPSGPAGPDRSGSRQDARLGGGRRLHIDLGRLLLPPSPVSEPDEIGESAEGDLDAVREGAKQERGGRDLSLEQWKRHIGVMAACCVEAGDQRQFD